jgi:uncharacterized protein (TIGR02145 family)
MKKLYIILAISLLSCAPELEEGSPFSITDPGEPPYLTGYGATIDSRDGKRYRTTEIGNHTWMADNLNYNANGSTCYENQDFYCEIYGRLYTWEAAMSACPLGWRLPNNAEWEDLVQIAGGEKVAGIYLKATNGWEERGNGRNSYGFAALPGGDSNGDTFFGAGIYGNWWSSDAEPIQGGNEVYMIKVHYRMNYNDENVIIFRSIEDHLFSVRCIQEN